MGEIIIMTQTKYENVFVEGVNVYRIINGEYHRLSQFVDNLGYYQTCFTINGKRKYVRVHRLIAETLIPNPNNLPMVNHIDGNRMNNCVDNLEWTDYKGNMQHATKQGRMHYNPENLKKAQLSRKRPVIASNGTEVLRFESATDAEKMGFNHRHISNCCNKRYGYKTHKGYEWRYENE